MRGHFHLRQIFERVEHHVRQIMLHREFMDALGEILQAHPFVERGVLLVERRNGFADFEVAVEVATEVAEFTQEPHCLRVVNTEGEEEKEVVGARLFHDDAAVV